MVEIEFSRLRTVLYTLLFMYAQRAHVHSAVLEVITYLIGSLLLHLICSSNLEYVL